MNLPSAGLNLIVKHRLFDALGYVCEPAEGDLTTVRRRCGKRIQACGGLEAIEAESDAGR